MIKVLLQGKLVVPVFILKMGEGLDYSNLQELKWVYHHDSHIIIVSKESRISIFLCLCLLF